MDSQPRIPDEENVHLPDPPRRHSRPFILLPCIIPQIYVCTGVVFVIFFGILSLAGAGGVRFRLFTAAFSMSAPRKVDICWFMLALPASSVRSKITLLDGVK